MECLSTGKHPEGSKVSYFRMSSPNDIFQIFLWIDLGYRLYSISDNLSKTLQAENMSAIDGQKDR